MIKNKNIATNAFIDSAKIAGTGIGEVFYVAQANGRAYNSLVPRVASGHLFADVAGAGIQAALDACVSERNDYVLVFTDTDDYDITAALTMNKQNVHLIGVGGEVPGMKYGCNNNVRIHQNTAATQVLTITGRACEIAGLFIKGVDDTTVISCSEHGLTVRNCMIGMATTAGSGTAYGIYGGSGEVTHWNIANNLITNYSPNVTGKTLGAAVYIVNGTRCIVRENLICTGSGTTTFTVGITIGGTPTFVFDNKLVEAVSGVFTKGITVAAGASVMGNMFSMTTAGDAITGGTANETVVNNYTSSAAGGALFVL